MLFNFANRELAGDIGPGPVRLAETGDRVVSGG
jgi:hypothetical protein